MFCMTGTPLAPSPHFINILTLLPASDDMLMICPDCRDIIPSNVAPMQLSTP